MIEIQTTSERLDKEKIIILIDGWGFNSLMYFLIRKLIPSNYGYINYSYSRKILNSNPIETKQYFLYFIDLITKDVNDLALIKSRSFYLYGQSLGGLFCMIIADKINIKKTMLIVPGCNLAESFWYGKYTRRLRDEMIKKYGTTLAELKEYWREISPDHYFKDKSQSVEFFVILSKNDEAIPTSNGEKLLELFRQRKINFKLLWSRSSHKMTLVKELLFLNNFKKWISEID